MNFVNYLASIAMQDDATGGLIGAGVASCCVLIFMIIYIVGMWKLFAKAGQPGWAGIVPIYNYYVTTQIAGRESWWTLLYWVFPPFWFIDLALIFGKTILYGILTVVFSGIPLLILAFGDAEYQGPVMKGKGFY